MLRTGHNGECGEREPVTGVRGGALSGVQGQSPWLGVRGESPKTGTWKLLSIWASNKDGKCANVSVIPRQEKDGFWLSLFVWLLLC